MTGETEVGHPYGGFIIRRSTLGYMGLNAIGRGRLLVEDSTLHGGHLINFRGDYGATWEGEVIIRNCRWIPNAGNIPVRPVVFGMLNDGKHDYRTADSVRLEDSQRPAAACCYESRAGTGHCVCRGMSLVSHG